MAIYHVTSLLGSSNKIKFYPLVLFVTIDIYLNGTTDYKVQKAKEMNETWRQNQSFQFFIQLVAQISICCIILLLMFETYPFQVGLYKVLVSKFRNSFILMVIYFILTCIVGSFRLVRSTLINVLFDHEKSI